jgi:hypothetical protein
MSPFSSRLKASRSVLRGSLRLLGNALFAANFLLGVAGCETSQAPSTFNDGELRAGAVTASKQGVSVKAAVLSAEDSRRMFGADINNTGVQTVWIELQNQTPEPLWLLRPGSDPDYFSPLEVAWSVHMPFTRAANARIDDRFDSLAFKSPILPGETRKGVIFINPERLTRLLNIDLLQRKGLIPFTLFLPVPDDAADPLSGTISFSYPEARIIHYKDLAALRAALERLPCCASDAGGTAGGDPLNTIFVGELPDIAAALVRRSYRRDAHPVDARQHVFGRGPDVVLRKQAQAGAPSTWMRLWLAPIRFAGQPLFLVQVGRPVGGRFVPRGAKDVVLHEDVDEARNLVVQDMMYSGGLDKLGFTTGVGAASPTHPRTTFGGARYHTDGLRASLFLATRPLSLSDVEFLDWAPYLEVPHTTARDESHQ